MESSQPFLETLLISHLRIRLRAYVEADGCHASAYFAPAGSLAVAQNFLRAGSPRSMARGLLEVMSRKMAAFHHGYLLQRHHFYRAKGRPFGGSAASVASLAENSQRSHRLRPLPPDHVLAKPAHSLLLLRRKSCSVCCCTVIDLRARLGHLRLLAFPERENLIFSSAGFGFWEHLCR